VLVIVVVLLLVATAITGALMRSALLDARQFTTDRRAFQADRLAEAGVARAAARLAGDPGYTGEDWAVELPANEKGAVAIHVKGESGRRTVEAVATFPIETDRSVRSRRSAVLTPQGGP
jgi:hypothetical protein